MGGIGSHQHGVMSTYYLKTAKNPRTKPTQYPKVQKSTLTHPTHPFHSFFFTKIYIHQIGIQMSGSEYSLLSYGQFEKMTFFPPDPLAESKGLVGLSFWLPSLLNLRHSSVLWVVNGPSTALHHLQNLSVWPFLGVPFSGPPPCSRFPFLGMWPPAILAAVVTSALLARAFSFVHSTQVRGVTR